MPVYQQIFVNRQMSDSISNSSNSNNQFQTPIVTSDNSGRSVTINISQYHSNFNQDSAEFSFDEEDENSGENINSGAPMSFLNMRSDGETINTNNNESYANNGYINTNSRRNINRPYMNPYGNSLSQSSSRSNEVVSSSLPLPPLPTHIPLRVYNSSIRYPPLQPLRRRNAFNTEIPNFTSSTLSVDSGNASLDSSSIDSINLDNSILRGVIPPLFPSRSHDYNHNQQISPSIENQNHPDNSDNHIQQELPINHDISTSMFFNTINRISSQCIYNEMNSSELMISSYPTSNTLFNHQDHTSQNDENDENDGKLLSFHNLNNELDILISKRRKMGKKFTKNLRFKLQNPKKSNVSNLNDDEEQKDNYGDFHFDITRAHECSFLKAGLIYKIKEPKPFEIPFTISFIGVNYPQKSISGTFNFNDSYNLKHWVYEHTSTVTDITGNKYVPFTGEIIDFETSDLRYNSQSIEIFNSSIIRDYYHTSTQDYHQVYNNMVTRQQLSRWNKLKPFKYLSTEEFLPILACNECLSKLQENFVLLRISIDLPSDINAVLPGMLVCIDRTSGELEVVSAQTRSKSFFEQYSINHEHFPGNIRYDHDVPVIMIMKCKKYVSPSLKFS